MLWRFLTEVMASRTLCALIQCCRQAHVAVAWATKSPETEALLQCGKLARAVIGTDGYVTHPKVLQECRDNPKVRVIAPDAVRLFHAKLYIFKLEGGQGAAIIGSHNLTRSAFARGGNIEASALLQCAWNEPVLQEMVTFVAQHWGDAESLQDGNFLFAYETQYAAKEAARRALREFKRLRAPRKGAAGPSPLSLNWDEYCRALQDDAHEGLAERVRMLEAVRKLFARQSSFSAMNVAQRKAVAGTFAKGEPTLDDGDWAWLGSPRGFGEFKTLVNTQPEGLSRALGHIRLQGPVSRTQFDAFVREFRKAFQGKGHKGGLRTASRLLAVKRPDWFVPVNSRNQAALCAALGLPVSRLSLDSYWADVIEPVHTSTWWRHPRPQVPSQARLWELRAALLDVLYYVPKVG